MKSKPSSLKKKKALLTLNKLRLRVAAGSSCIFGRSCCSLGMFNASIMLWGPLVLVKATAHAQLTSARITLLLYLLILCLLLTLSTWSGGASTCWPGTYILPHSDPLPPQGGTGLPRLISSSSGCPPGWLCSGKLIFKQYDQDGRTVKPVSLRCHIKLITINLPDVGVSILFFVNRLSKPVLFHSSLSYFVFPRCSLASWIPSYSYVPCPPVTSALLTWLPTWSTRCMSWRQPWLCLSSLTRGLRCSSSRSVLIVNNYQKMNSDSDNEIIYFTF